MTATPDAGMVLSPDGFAQIEAREGLRLEAYKDKAGYLTIGVGHKLTPQELDTGILYATGSMWHAGISEDTARAVFEHDSLGAAGAVRADVRVPLTQHQFDALVSFVFNIGGPAFQKSGLLVLLNQGDYASVPAHLALWVHSGGELDPVLVKRRVSETAQWNTADEAAA